MCTASARQRGTKTSSSVQDSQIASSKSSITLPVSRRGHSMSRLVSFCHHFPLLLTTYKDRRMNNFNEKMMKTYTSKPTICAPRHIMCKNKMWTQLNSCTLPTLLPYDKQNACFKLKCNACLL